jgi:hypothetical protein
VIVYLFGVEASDFAVQRVIRAKHGVDEMYQRLVGKAFDDLLERTVEYVRVARRFRHGTMVTGKECFGNSEEGKSFDWIASRPGGRSQ